MPKYYPASKSTGNPGFMIIDRADEQDGAVSTYEVLVRDHSNQPPSVLARYPAITLFPPLRKAVRIMLNGSMGPPGQDNGVFSAPPLMPGQEYGIAVRACVEVSCHFA